MTAFFGPSLEKPQVLTSRFTGEQLAFSSRKSLTPLRQLGFRNACLPFATDRNFAFSLIVPVRDTIKFFPSE